MKPRNVIKFDLNNAFESPRHEALDIINDIEQSNARIVKLMRQQHITSSPVVDNLIASQNAIANAIKDAKATLAFDPTNTRINNHINESLRLAEELVKLLKIRKIEYIAEVQKIVVFNIDQLILSNNVLANAFSSPASNLHYGDETNPNELDRMERAKINFDAGNRYIEKNMIPQTELLTLTENLKVHRAKNLGMAAFIATGITLIVLGVTIASLGSVGIIFGAALIVAPILAKCCDPGSKPLSQARKNEELKKVPLYNAHHSIFKLKQETAVIANLSATTPRNR